MNPKHKIISALRQANEGMKQAFDLVEYKQAPADLLIMAADMRTLQLAIVEFLKRHDPDINKNPIQNLGGGMMLIPREQDK